jgi:flagellar protein FliO/FliZ
MWTTIFLFLLLIVGLAAVGLWLYSRQSGVAIGDVFFGAKPEKRLGVVEITPVDSRRRLVLIRRDDVEHLIMIGGPVDIVVETNAGHVQSQPTARNRTVNGSMNGGSTGEREAPVFGRQARTLTPPQGQAE